MLPGKLPCIHHPSLIFFFFCSFPYCVTMHAKLLQLYPSLCDSMGCRLPDSPVYGTVQVRILSGLPFPPPGDLPDPGIEPRSLAFPALAGWFFTTGAIWKVLFSLLSSLNANLPLLSLMLPHFLVYGKVKTFPWTTSFSPLNDAEWIISNWSFPVHSEWVVEAMVYYFPPYPNNKKKKNIPGTEMELKKIL